MTFSIVARCETTGQVGVAITSSSPAVAARCAFVRAGVGAVASQNVTNPRLGPLVLDAVEQRVSVSGAVRRAVDGDPFASYRQVLAIGTDGSSAFHCGDAMLGVWGVASGSGCVAAGNLLRTDDVPVAMVAAFEQSSGPLADRLLKALNAGSDAGGEAGAAHSAGLLVADKQPWPYVDLRVDWSDDPFLELERIWQVYRPQADDYVIRAISPGTAPSYGVPGDE